MNKRNLKEILPELIGENLERGKGLFVRSVMKSQVASPAFTSVYAALVAVINTKFLTFMSSSPHSVLLKCKRVPKVAFMLQTQQTDLSIFQTLPRCLD